MDMVFGRRTRMILLGIAMREIISMIESMDMVSFTGNQEIFTKELIKMMREMDMEKCILLMVQLTKVIGLRVYKMEKEL
jgi:hypothetical protein